MSNTYLTRNIAAGDKRIGTFSFWLKRSGQLSSTQYFFNPFGTGGFNDNSGNTDWIGFFLAANSQFGITSWSGGIQVRTTRVFRDTSAWYHIVVRIDTTQSSASDRIRIYVNGQQQTSLNDNDQPGQNHDFNCLGTNGATFQIGNSVSGTHGSPSQDSKYFNGYIAQAIYAQGQSYAPTTFGSTNAQGTWVPITTPSVTYGTNGFKLDFAGTGTSADASGFGADTSGQANHFTSNNLHTNPSTTDTPANNFATLNVNDQWNSHTPQESVRGVLTKSGRNFSSNGPLGGSERYYNITGTIAVPSAGKWYWEAKPIAGSNGLGFRWTMGLFTLDRKYSTNSLREYDNSQGQVGTYTADGKVSANGSVVSTYETLAVNDIVSFKYDADNRDLYIAKNGTYFNSGNAVLTSSNISDTGQKLVVLQNGSDGNVASQVNFGQPPYTIASGNSDGNGYGNFEYAVPTGYYALCTQNVAAYGG